MQQQQPVQSDRLRTQALYDVRHNGRALQYTTEHQKGDREIVLEAVRQDGSALQYAADHLRGDREIVLEAVRQVGAALKYAAPNLRGDREIVLEAVRQNGNVLFHASNHLKDDGSFLYEMSEFSEGHPDAVRKYASLRIHDEMAKDPGYLERYAPAQVKPARQDTHAYPDPDPSNKQS
jgi:hypothetical protein